MSTEPGTATGQVAKVVALPLRQNENGDLEHNLDSVATLGQNMLERIDSLLGELQQFNNVYKENWATSNRFERRVMADVMPGLNDIIIVIRGLHNAVSRIVKTRSELHVGRRLGGDERRSTNDDETTRRRGRRREDDDESAQAEQDNKDRGTIFHFERENIEATWVAVKKMKGLLALHRRFPMNQDGNMGPIVDAILEDGSEWLKVSIIPEKKLVQEIERDQWQGHPDDDSSDEDEDSGAENERCEISIVEVVFQLVMSARINRCSTRMPRIRLFLPNITEGRLDGIDTLLKRVRSLGVSKKGEGDVEIIVDCANSTLAKLKNPLFETAISSMLANTELDRRTPTINLELTLLLSLVSDISHSRAKIEDWSSKATKFHIEAETERPGLRVSKLYIVIQSRDMVCTQDVVQEMRNVLDDIATETEKSRAAILFGRQDLGDNFDKIRHGGLTAAERNRQLRADFQRLSIYPIPEGLKLPIDVVGQDEFDPDKHPEMIEAGSLPPSAATVWGKLDRQHARACFLYGWAKNITTISANLLNTRLVEMTVDQERTDAREVGPLFYLLPFATGILTARPCPPDHWESIKDAKHDRKNSRLQEVKGIKRSDNWGHAVGVPASWTDKKYQNFLKLHT